MLLENNISTLLHTFQEPNYALLLELVAGAKAVSICASELLVVYYFSENALTKTRAKELLLQTEALSLSNFLEQESTLIIPERNPYYTLSQQEILHKKLEQLATIPLLSIGKITTAIALYHQQALGWALNYGPKEQQYQILQECLHGQTIFYLNKYHPLYSFPSALTRFKHLTHITFFVADQPTIKSSYPSSSFLIPNTIQNCQQLRALHLYGGVVKHIPCQALQQLTKLRSVSLTTHQTIDIEALQAALPQCQFNIRKS